MPDRISRRALIAAGAAGAAGVALAGTLAALSARPEAKLSTRARAIRRDGPLPLDDPASDEWLEADPILVALSPQQLAPPFLAEAGIDQLELEAMHDGERLGLRLSWDDPDLDDLDGIARFHDAAAVQLPVRAADAPPPITMGGPGAPVHILQWRASWERDIENRRQTVEAIYPNVVRDETPEEVLPPEVAALFYVGRVVGNPLSSLGRESSVEEIVAEGFGSVTALAQQRATGRARHGSGRWTVAIGLPLERGEAGDSLEPGSVWPVSFAVWLGSKGNRGSRKQFADWIELELEA